MLKSNSFNPVKFLKTLHDVVSSSKKEQTTRNLLNLSLLLFIYSLIINLTSVYLKIRNLFPVLQEVIYLIMHDLHAMIQVYLS